MRKIKQFKHALERKPASAGARPSPRRGATPRRAYVEVTAPARPLHVGQGGVQTRKARARLRTHRRRDLLARHGRGRRADGPGRGESGDAQARRGHCLRAHDSRRRCERRHRQRRSVAPRARRRCLSCGQARSRIRVSANRRAGHAEDHRAVAARRNSNSGEAQRRSSGRQSIRRGSNASAGRRAAHRAHVHERVAERTTRQCRGIAVRERQRHHRVPPDAIEAGPNALAIVGEDNTVRVAALLAVPAVVVCVVVTPEVVFGFPRARCCSSR